MRVRGAVVMSYAMLRVRVSVTSDVAGGRSVIYIAVEGDCPAD